MSPTGVVSLTNAEPIIVRFCIAHDCEADKGRASFPADRTHQQSADEYDQSRVDADYRMSLHWDVETGNTDRAGKQISSQFHESPSAA